MNQSKIRKLRKPFKTTVVDPKTNETREVWIVASYWSKDPWESPTRHYLALIDGELVEVAIMK